MTRIFKLLAISLLASLPTLCLADEEYKVSLNGTNNYITVNPGTQEITLWGISKGKMSSYLEVSGNLPEGTKLKARAALVKKSVSQAKNQKKQQYPVKLLTQKKLSALHSQCLEISVEGSEPDEEDLLDVNDYPAIESPVCDAIGTDVLTEMAGQLSGTFGGEWQAGNACSYLLSVAGEVWLDPGEWCDKLTEEQIATLEPFGLDCEAEEEEGGTTLLALTLPTASIDYRGLLHKDSCNKKSKYVVLVTLDFSDIAHLITEPLNLSLRVNEFKRKSGKESALKPESEGRYAPKPIVMMNWLGNSCGNRIDVVKWKKRKPKTVTPLSVYSLLAYKDMVLNLAVVESALTGGKGTAELYTGDESYGVCFKLQKKRQNKNGYPS